MSCVQLVKLLELREANHIDFCRIKDVADEVLQLYNNPELREILKLLMDPTWVATGLKIHFDSLVSITSDFSFGYKVPSNLTVEEIVNLGIIVNLF